MRDNLEKFLIYFKGKADYWSLNDKFFLDDDKERLNYPLSFKDRLYQNHYTDFDQEGIPMFPSKEGELVHFCTGMCSYAFAHWEEYLNTNKINHAENVIKIANYLIKITEVTKENGLMIYDYASDKDFGNGKGTSCAMNQGEAMSVMCRAYRYSKNSKYLDIAMKLATPFKFEYGKEGVFLNLKNTKGNWYLEGGEIILNGHIYALFGLYELYQVSNNKEIIELFISGEEALEKTIASFDTGSWSWYWLNEPKYIASAMYHNLHIVQLFAMYKITGKEIYLNYSERFEKYSQSQVNRFRSGFELLKSKIKSRF